MYIEHDVGAVMPLCRSLYTPSAHRIKVAGSCHDKDIQTKTQQTRHALPLSHPPSVAPVQRARQAGQEFHT